MYKHKYILGGGESHRANQWPLIRKALLSSVPWWNCTRELCTLSVLVRLSLQAWPPRVSENPERDLQLGQPDLEPRVRRRFPPVFQDQIQKGGGRPLPVSLVTIRSFSFLSFTFLRDRYFFSFSMVNWMFFIEEQHFFLLKVRGRGPWWINWFWGSRFESGNPILILHHGFQLTGRLRLHAGHWKSRNEK